MQWFGGVSARINIPSPATSLCRIDRYLVIINDGPAAVIDVSFGVLTNAVCVFGRIFAVGKALDVHSLDSHVGRVNHEVMIRR